MKRDVEIIRKIMLECDNYPKSFLDGISLKFDKVSDESVKYHTYLLGLGGYLETTPLPESANCNQATPKSITWSGYEFIDCVRNDTFWNKFKAILSNGGLGLGTAILMTLTGRPPLTFYDDNDLQDNSSIISI